MTHVESSNIRDRVLSLDLFGARLLVGAWKVDADAGRWLLVTENRTRRGVGGGGVVHELLSKVVARGSC